VVPNIQHHSVKEKAASCVATECYAEGVAMMIKNDPILYVHF